MTIFVRTVKELIDRVLIKSIEDSIAEDSGTFSGFFRNTQHSDQQRALTRALQKTISDFSKEDTDKNNLIALQQIINKTDTAVEILRAKKSWKRGALNDTLSKLNSNLDRFLRILGEKPFNFIDVEDNDDPFNLLCAHAVYYLGEHILCPPGEGMLAKIYETVSSSISQSTAMEIRASKEACLLKNIILCNEKLSGLDSEKPNFKSLRKTFVLETIETILRENAEICEESKPVDTIPVQVTLIAVAKVKAPPLKPSRGRLKVAMDNACEEIEARTAGDKPIANEKELSTFLNV